MKAIEFEGQSTLLGPPESWQRGTCSALPVKIEPLGMVSYWKPSIEELQGLIAGACVELVVFTHQHPPVAVQVREVIPLP